MSAVRPFLAFCAVGSAALAIGFAATHWLKAAKAARIECPREFAIGERDMGEMVTVPFPIKNVGQSPLELTGIRSSCACTGLSRKTGDAYERLEGLMVGPGSSEECCIRFRVLDDKDAKSEHFISFLTNDLANPEVQVRVTVSRVKGRMQFEPAVLSLGALAPGRKHTFTVKVFDDPKYGRSVAAVRCSLPIAAVRFVPEAAGASDQSGQRRLLGRICLEVASDEPLELSGHLCVYASADLQAHERIPLSGRIRPWLEPTPRVLVLPRRSGDGWIRTARILCAFPEGTAAKVELPEVPPELAAVAEPEDGRWFVTVKLMEPMPEPGKRLTMPVHWRIGDRTGSETCFIHVNPAYEK